MEGALLWQRSLDLTGLLKERADLDFQASHLPLKDMMLAKFTFFPMTKSRTHVETASGKNSA